MISISSFSGIELTHAKGFEKQNERTTRSGASVNL